MTKGKNKFTGQEKAGHKLIVCDKCGIPGGIKGTQPLRKITKGQEVIYVHQKRCPMPGSFPFPKRIADASIKLPTDEDIAVVEATKSPDERMA